MVVARPVLSRNGDGDLVPSWNFDLERGCFVRYRVINCGCDKQDEGLFAKGRGRHHSGFQLSQPIEKFRFRPLRRQI